MPYIMSAPGNRVYVNGVRRDGYQAASTTTPASLNWDVPDEFKNETAVDLLQSALGRLIKNLKKDFDKGFKDMVEQYDNFSFRYYLLSVCNWPTSVIDFVETVTAQTNHFALSVPAMVMEYMDYDTKDWRTIKHGMSRLPSAMSYLFGYHNITYGARVTGVHYAINGGVDIIATGCNGTITVNFDKVILAVPPAALKMIADRPRFSVPKELAIRSMHFEALYKMGLRFKTRFWERVDADSTRGGQSTTDLPIRWVVYPSNGIGSDGPGVLIVFAWMTDATTWLPLTPTERRSLAMFCLADMYNDKVDPQTKKKINVYDLLIGTADAVWSTNSSTGVSNFLPGQFLARFEPARQPEGGYSDQANPPRLPRHPKPENTIFFAGEHLSRHNMWIAGALQSAHYAVCQMIGKVDPLMPPRFPTLYDGGQTGRGGDVERFPDHLDPTRKGPLTEENYENYGVPLLLGSREDQSTAPTVKYEFNPREPLFTGDDGWTLNKLWNYCNNYYQLRFRGFLDEGHSIPTFPLHLGGDASHSIGCELTSLSGPTRN